MGKESKKKRFLTVYTASATVNEPDWPLSHLILGSYLSRGDAIRACADYVIQQMELRGQLRSVASKDDRIVKALKETGMSEDDIESLLIDNKVCGWKIPLKPRRTMRSMIVDIIGGESCFILKSACGRYEFRFDVDENDVVGKGGLQLWTCVTSGTDDEDHDPEWEQAFPEIFLTEKDAVHCAIDGIIQCLDGYELDEKKIIIAEARDRIAENGYFEFDLNDQKQRRVDVWSTPLDIGQSSGKTQRI